jgi:hypothetical protein
MDFITRGEDAVAEEEAKYRVLSTALLTIKP